MANFLTRIFGSRNQRLVSQYSKTVMSVNAFEESVQALDDEAFKAKTAELQKRYADGETLDDTQIQAALDMLMSDKATPAQMAAFLMALRVRGETVDEITGTAQYLRARMTRVGAPEGAVDIVGTGGDNHGTYNVSTCAALVSAGTGLKVAKHGNRSVSSKSGASDVLAALGVKIDVGPDVVSRAIDEAGVGFMWAPMHHSTMKAWAPIRAELGVRTLFNLIGPVCNPASVTRQVVGVYDRRWLEPVAHVLSNLGSRHAWVVHGSDGMDELTLTGPSFVAELIDGDISLFEVAPSDAGLKTRSLDELRGGDAVENAGAIREVLAGKPSAFRDIVLLNTAAALIVGDKAANLDDGVERAARAIDGGDAMHALERLVAVTNGAA